MQQKAISTYSIIKSSLSSTLDNTTTKYFIRTRFSFSIILTFASTLLDLASPLILKKAIDLLSNTDEESQVFDINIDPLFIVIAYGVTWITSQAVSHIKTIILDPVIQNGVRKITLKLLKHLNTLSLSFHADRKLGSVLEIINKAQYGTESLITNGLINIIPLASQILIAIGGLSAWYGYEYGLSLSGILITYGGFTFIMTKRSNRLNQESNRISQESTARVAESLQNFETIQIFDNQNYEMTVCNEVLERREAAVIINYRMTEFVLTGQAIILGSGLTLLTTLTFNDMQSDSKYDISDFVLINTYLLQFIWPLNQSGYFIRDFRRAINNLRNVFDLLNEQPEIIDSPTAQPLRIQECSITFRNVSFSYDARKDALKDISFTVPFKSKLAIVGKNWSGKSTISKLIFRFYDPTSGVIEIDAQDIKQVTLNSLRSIISIVPQEVVLFDDTILNNIKYGNMHASIEDVDRVIQNCFLQDLIDSLPQQLQTKVGERGVKLSGGARQLIGIARAILKDPKIFIFDEATASLDPQMERLIGLSLEKLHESATVIVIAHRLSTVKNCDQILVMDNGQIIEFGTHEDLISSDGLYSKFLEGIIDVNEESLLTLEEENNEESESKSQHEIIEKDAEYDEETPLNINNEGSGSLFTFFKKRQRTSSILDYQSASNSLQIKEKKCQLF